MNTKKNRLLVGKIVILIALISIPFFLGDVKLNTGLKWGVPFYQPDIDNQEAKSAAHDQIVQAANIITDINSDNRNNKTSKMPAEIKQTEEDNISSGEIEGRHVVVSFTGEDSSYRLFVYAGSADADLFKIADGSTSTVNVPSGAAQQKLFRLSCLPQDDSAAAMGALFNSGGDSPPDMIGVLGKCSPSSSTYVLNTSDKQAEIVQPFICATGKSEAKC